MKAMKSIYRAMLLGLAITSTGALADHSEMNPNVTEVKPGDTVKVARIPGSIYLRIRNDPDDLIWDRLPMYRTALYSAPPVHQSVKLRFEQDTAFDAKHIYFQVARTDERFYLRLRWKDGSEDRATTVDDFRDGVAVQFALKGADTSYMMGSGPDKPVNIWYWRADREQIEDLAAGGYGSTTSLPEQLIDGASAWVAEEIQQDSEWHVVMSRPLKVKGEHQVDLSRKEIPVVFAVWEGSHNQRDGDKRVTPNWILLDNGQG